MQGQRCWQGTYQSVVSERNKTRHKIKRKAGTQDSCLFSFLQSLTENKFTIEKELTPSGSI